MLFLKILFMNGEKNLRALLIIAHGSRREDANNEIRELAKKLKDSVTNFDFVDYGFLEIAQPSIEQQLLILCSNQSISDIYIFPYFLTAGNHITKDIPEIINSVRKQFSVKNIIITDYLGKDEQLKNFILNMLSKI